MGLFDYFKKSKTIKKEDMGKQIATSYSQWQTELYALYSKTDETAETALETFAMKVAKKVGNYQHKDPKVQELVQRNFEKMQGSITFVVKEMVEEAFMKGFVGAEIVWQIEKGELRTKKIIVLDSTECSYSLETEIFRYNGKIIPEEKLIYHQNKRAKAKKVNKLIDVKEILFQMWCQYLESFTSPIIHGKSDNPVKLGEDIKNLFFKKSISTDLESEITAIKLDGGGGNEILNAIEYIDKNLYRLFFLGGNFSQGEKSGTTANSKVNENMFEDVTDWKAEEMRELLLETWVRKIIQYNIGEIDDYGAFVNPTQRDADMLQKLAIALKTLADMGIITIEDFDKIREIFGFEKLKEDEEINEKKEDVEKGIQELIDNAKDN